jgi:UDP-N-acetylglucosamine 2-epimerase (hydrolysing)
MKKILFLTGTRADFGKLKSLIVASQNATQFKCYIFATGMHLIEKYGKTIDEIYKSGLNNIFPYINHDRIEYMDRTLASTILGLSHFIAQNKPDLIVVHGDRVEALAGAIVGSLNNILVAHVEGGEVSGTIDELIRHAISKMAHIHLVSNSQAAKRLIQMGELESSIHIIGSPDLDIMLSGNLKPLDYVKKYYEIEYDEYALLLFHPVTTEIEKWEHHTNEVVSAVLESKQNFVVIFPNNDIGSDIIMDAYKRLKNNPRFRIFPSIRLEYFLVLLKFSKFIIGNSSAGIREAPYYGVPTIDIGTRQNNRAEFSTIIHCDYSKTQILYAISLAKPGSIANSEYFGSGDSQDKFLALIKGNEIWKINCQKQFQERD